jgi:hypothetical protein
MTRDTLLVHEVEIGRTPAEVFAFATDARTWSAWHPTTVAVRGPAGPPHAGDLFHETVRAGPVQGEIAWRVVEAAPERRFTVEGRVDFPLMRRTAVTITYLLAPSGQGTHFRRELRYRPARPWSRLADCLFFRGHNARQSVTALERLRTALER